jgi:putative ABC transport system permease protein
MRWIWQVALSFLKANLFRNFLTSVGVALGVALTTALFIASDSAEKTLDKQVELQYGTYDIQFGYKKSGAYLTDDEAQKIAQFAGVSNVSEVLIPYLPPIPREVISQPTYWGVQEDSPEMKSYKVLQGRYPKEGAEVAVTAAFANRENLKVGDQISFPFPPYGTQTVKLVGILEPSITSGGGNMAFFPLSWVQDTMELSNRVNLVQLDLQKGANKDF